MEPIVLDSSEVLKWYLEEPGAEEALAFQANDSLTLHAPDLVLVEVDSVLCAMVRQRALTARLVEAMRTSVRGAGLTLHGFRSLLDPAVEASRATNKALYDCLYLALAERLDATLITADRSFAAGLERTPLGGRVRLLAGI
jgi:predicted nucleic acid-binding protein